MKKKLQKTPNMAILTLFEKFLFLSDFSKNFKICIFEIFFDFSKICIFWAIFQKISYFAFLTIFSIFPFFSNFKETYKNEFLSYDCNQVVKKHLNYSNNSLVKIIWARAQLRARCTPKWKTQEKRIFKHFCNAVGWERGFRARNRARAHIMRVNGFS